VLLVREADTFYSGREPHLFLLTKVKFPHNQVLPVSHYHHTERTELLSAISLFLFGNFNVKDGFCNCADL